MEKSGNMTDAVVAICPSQEIRVDIDPCSTRLSSIDVFDNCWPSIMRFCQGLLVLKSNVLLHESEIGLKGLKLQRLKMMCMLCEISSWI